MKKNIFRSWRMVQFGLLMLVSMQIVAQSKPQVQVSFDIDPRSSLNDFFDSEISTMEETALTTLVSGLTNYIGFLEFISGTTENKLKITLNDRGSGSIPEYWLAFELTTTEGTTFNHEWEFIDSSEDSHTYAADDLLKKLNEDWNTYLRSSYNMDMVTRLFDEIAFSLPDSSHYYVDNGQGRNEAILPFKHEEFNMAPNASDFLVVVNGNYNDDTRSSATIRRNGKAIGEVEPNMSTSPTLLGCIRIEIPDFPNITPLNGKVFIINYKRNQTNGDNETVSDPNTFTSSNQE